MSSPVPPDDGRVPTESRADWARTVAGEIRRLDPREAAALIQVYVRRLSCDDAAKALDVSREEFGRTLATAMSSLGRALARV